MIYQSSKNIHVIQLSFKVILPSLNQVKEMNKLVDGAGEEAA